MEGLFLVADVAAILVLVYWVVAHDTDAVKAPSRGFFAFVESVGAGEKPKKRRLNFQEQRQQARDD
jgi:hypothetical protein